MMFLQEEILVDSFAYACVAMVLAGVVRGFAGFGGGLLMVPFMSLIYSPAEAVATATLTGIVGGVQMIPEVRRHANWREILPIALAAGPLTPLGTYFLIIGDPDLIRRVIGAIVLFFATVMLWGWTYNGRRDAFLATLAGAFSGVINGLAAMGGPVATLYFVASRESAVIQRANITITVTIFSVFILISLVISDVVGFRVYARAAVMLVPYIGAVWIGARLFGVAFSLYRRIALGLIFAAGLLAVLV